MVIDSGQGPAHPGREVVWRERPVPLVGQRLAGARRLAAAGHRRFGGSARPHSPEVQVVEGRKARRRSRTQKRFREHALRAHPFCRWCQCPLEPGTATTDHVVPLSRGGSNHRDNLCLACLPCNQERQNRLPSEPPSKPPGKPLGKAPGEPPSDPAEWRQMWVAWTRYPGGRWRATLRSRTPAKLLRKAKDLVGKVAQTVILPDGQDPAEGGTRERTP